MAKVKYITEVLSEIDKNPSLLFDGEYKKRGNGGPLGQVFFHAFTEAGKFLLPLGLPPYQPCDQPLGLTPMQFLHIIPKFSLLCQSTTPLMRREHMFIQFCENIHPDEADILIAVKDQNLTDLYPNITPELVVRAGFLEEQDVQNKPKQSTSQIKSELIPEDVSTPSLLNRSTLRKRINK